MDCNKNMSADNPGTDSETGSQGTAIYERPTGLKGLYYHPITQVVMLGLVCFMGPGLFNALTGLGGAGQVDPTTSANANSTHYATFAVCAFFSGSVNNKLGSRLTLLLGITGFSLSIGSYLALNIHPHAGSFVIASGAVQGLCAGLLWTAQGSLMMSYATESQKGMFIGIFWAIFNLGAVVGAAVSLGQNIHSTANSVQNGTYIGILVLTLIGVTIPMLMVPPEKMTRTDGTKVMTPRHPSWKVEIYGLWVTLCADPLIILLVPMFFVSNWFYAWQFNEYNDALFNIRARSLNNLVYWVSQMIGSISIGLILDSKHITRRIRGFLGWAILLIMVFVVHIWAYFYQRQYTRESLPPNSNDKVDIFDHGYAGRILVYMFMGLLDAMWQTTIYWIIGAMSNDPARLAHLAGIYKSIQSAGSAGSWRADAVKTPYMAMFISTWALLGAGLVFALPVLYFRVKNHTEISDEALMHMDDSGHIRDTSQIENIRKRNKVESQSEK